jgi:hypothetical protein
MTKDQCWTDVRQSAYDTTATEIILCHDGHCCGSIVRVAVHTFRSDIRCSGDGSVARLFDIKSKMVENGGKRTQHCDTFRR